MTDDLTPCEFADAIAALCECDEPCDICITEEGRCATPDDCKCKALEPKPGEVWRSN